MPEQGPYVYTGNQFERLGHPGKYVSSIYYTTGILDLTGSNYGYNAIVVKTAGGATASLSAGGSIGLGDLTAGVVYDLSVKQVSAGTNAAIYVLKRQGI